MAVAKAAFLSALTAPTGVGNSVTGSVNAVVAVSSALQVSSGLVGAYGIPATEDIYAQLQDFMQTSNKIGISIASSANTLNWAATAFIKIINNIAGKTAVTANDITAMQRYLTGKLLSYNPIDFVTPSRTLKDEIIAYKTTMSAMIPIIQNNIDQMQAAVNDAQKQLDAAHSAAEKARILSGVGKLVNAMCDSAAIYYSTKITQADAVNNAANREPNAVEMEDRNARPGYNRLEEPGERADRIKTKAGITYIVGTGLGKIFGGILDTAAATVAVDVPSGSVLADLRVQIDLLETKTIPLYRDHIIPSVNSVLPQLDTAVNQLITVSNAWTTISNDLTRLVTNYNTWAADSSYSLQELKTSLTNLLSGWRAIATATDAVTPTPSSSSSNSNNATVNTNNNAAAALFRSFNVTTLKELSQTPALLDALKPIPIESTGGISLPQSQALIEYAMSNLVPLTSTSTALAKVVDLAKTTNSISSDIDIILQSISYFIEKLSTYTSGSQLKNNPASVLRSLGTKAKVLADSLPAQVEEVKRAAVTATNTSTDLTTLISQQSKILTSAINELKEQKTKVEAIVDDEKRKQASLSQRLSTDFKKIFTDGLFSKATLDFIAALLGIDPSNSAALDDAQTSLDNITTAITQAQSESRTLTNASPNLDSTTQGLAQVRIAFNSIADGFSKIYSKLNVLATTIKAENVDWDEFTSELPAILVGWRRYYNSLAGKTSVDDNNGTPQLPIASAKLVVRRNRSNVIVSSYYPTIGDRLNSLSSSIKEATSKSIANTAVNDARNNIKVALAPADGATTALQDITDNIVVVRTKVVDMRTRLSKSQWAASLTEKVVDFEKQYNALETNSRSTAGQIYWFGQKNIKVLNDLQAKAKANNLTVADFQSDIRYLENKVAVFVTLSSGLTLDHKNLQGSMGSISEALKNSITVLNDLIPKMQARLDQAKSDLDKEQDKIKKAAILKAVGQGLSAIGGGAGIYGVVKGNMKAAGFAIGATLIGGVLSLVAGIIDGDPNKIGELQATIASLNAQIPDMQTALDAMNPCIADAADVQTALGNMSNSWQVVNNKLSNIDRDYLFWLTNNFVLDDFLFDCDDDVTAWNTVCSILKKFAFQGADGTNDEDDGNTSSTTSGAAVLRATNAKVLPAIRNAAFGLLYPLKPMFMPIPPSQLPSSQLPEPPNPVSAFEQSVKALLDSTAITTSKAIDYANQAISGAKSFTGPGGDFTNYIKNLQTIGNEAFEGAQKDDVLARNAQTDGGVAVGELSNEIGTLNNKINEINGKIYDATHVPWYEQLGDFFKHFGDSIAGIFSGDIKKALIGIGTIAAPVLAGIPINAVNTVDDARDLVNKLEDANKALHAQYDKLVALKAVVDKQVTSSKDLTNTITLLRNSTQNLKLDLSPTEMWDDFLLDKPDILTNGNLVIQRSNAVKQSAASFPPFPTIN